MRAVGSVAGISAVNWGNLWIAVLGHGPDGDGGDRTGSFIEQGECQHRHAAVEGTGGDTKGLEA